MEKKKDQGIGGKILVGIIAVLMLLVAALFLCLFAMSLPIFALFQGEIMSVIIIGIAVWSAWKMNRREKLTINGPFELAPAAVGVDEPLQENREP